jgi:predicted DNA-binding transcriptional regulator AlpA
MAVRTWLTFPEMAEDLNLPTGTLYAYHRRGDGPQTYRFGKHLRVRRSDYEIWEESHLSG